MTSIISIFFLLARMKNSLFLVVLIITFCSYRCLAQTISGPEGSNLFGRSIVVLTNGNYVVRDPTWSNGNASQVGAVYLYNGRTHELISTLTGSNSDDQIGAGIIVLKNGNYLLVSTFWDNGSIVDAGAVTWCNGTTGVNGVVSELNSLVGSTANDRLGYRVTALSNGNYIVPSPYWDNGSVVNAGAATWCNGVTGLIGTVSRTNSLVGTKTYDEVGSYGITVLSNSNYLVSSPLWTNGSFGAAGAITWGSGKIGISGEISAANSLIGGLYGSLIGTGGVLELTNGNYVVCSPESSSSVYHGGGSNLGR